MGSVIYQYRYYYTRIGSRPLPVWFGAFTYYELVYALMKLDSQTNYTLDERSRTIAEERRREEEEKVRQAELERKRREERQRQEEIRRREDEKILESQRAAAARAAKFKPSKPMPPPEPGRGACVSWQLVLWQVWGGSCVCPYPKQLPYRRSWAIDLHSYTLLMHGLSMVDRLRTKVGQLHGLWTKSIFVPTQAWSDFWDSLSLPPDWFSLSRISGTLGEK